MASFIEADGGYYLDSFVKQPWLWRRSPFPTITDCAIILVIPAIRGGDPEKEEIVEIRIAES